MPPGFTPADFIVSASGRQIGRTDIQVTLSIHNPTGEPICVAEGIMGYASIVSARHPDRELESFVPVPELDDGIGDAGEWYDRNVEHARKGDMLGGPSSPEIDIAPGETYSLRQIRNLGPYALLYGNAETGTGKDWFPAPRSDYLISMDGAYIYRSDLLTTRLKRGLAGGRIGVLDGLTITEDRPGGVYWRLFGVRPSERFRLNLQAPPPGYGIVFDWDMPVF